MVSFWKLLRVMEGDEPHLLDDGEESKAMRVVRTGASLHASKDCGNFWDDFVSVCNDSEGLSELLDVPVEKIGGWASRVKEILSKVDAADDHSTSNKKAKTVTTGKSPIINPDDGVDAMPNETADTRPMP